MNRKKFLNLFFTFFLGIILLLKKNFSRAAAIIAAPQKDWDSIDFSFLDYENNELKGLAIKIPEKFKIKNDLYIVSKICPHQGCELGYEKNFNIVSDIIGKKLLNPVIFCRCHLSVFDPANNGQILNGPAPRSPWIFEYSLINNNLKIENIEKGVGIFN